MTINAQLIQALQSANIQTLADFLTFIYNHIDPYYSGNDSVNFRYNMYDFGSYDYDTDTCIGCMATVCIVNASQWDIVDYVNTYQYRINAGDEKFLDKFENLVDTLRTPNNMFCFISDLYNYDQIETIMPGLYTFMHKTYKKEFNYIFKNEGKFNEFLKYYLEEDNVTPVIQDRFGLIEFYVKNHHTLLIHLFSDMPLLIQNIKTDYEKI